MTRINCVPVQELNRLHLITEYRELPRIFPLAKFCLDAPKEYVLGPGHMKFFYNKLMYLYLRQIQLVEEMHKRGYHTSFHPQSLYDEWFPKKGHMFKDWIPTPEAIELNRKRLKERGG